MDNIWVDYYLKQAGSGISGYAGHRYQNGNGFWGTILKRLRPALKYIKRPLLNAASNITKDMSNGSDFSTSASKRLIESGQDMLSDGFEKLIKKQKGSGTKKRKKKPIKKSIRKMTKKKKKNLYKKRRPKKKIVNSYL